MKLVLIAVCKSKAGIAIRAFVEFYPRLLSELFNSHKGAGVFNKLVVRALMAGVSFSISF